MIRIVGTSIACPRLRSKLLPAGQFGRLPNGICFWQILTRADLFGKINHEEAEGWSCAATYAVAAAELEASSFFVHRI